MKKIHLLILVVFIIPTKLFSQSAWTNYNKSNKNILSDTVLKSIVDSYGNKWIVTAKGLSKFDGNSCINYEKNIIEGKFYINTDNKGNLYFGTPNDGLSKFDGTNWINFSSANIGIVTKTIKQIHRDSQDNIWIGTFYGLSKYDGINWVQYKTTNSGINSDNIYQITTDLLGNNWIATKKGLSKYDGINWINFNCQNSGFFDIDGNIISFVKQMQCDSQGNIWVRTDDTGLSKFNGNNWTNYNTTNSGISSDSIFQITIDSQGNKWLATNKGLSKFDGINWTTFNTLNSGIKSNFVTNITFDAQENMWIATDKGISKFDGINWINYDTKNSNISSDYINHIEIDSKGDKWIGTHFGIVKLNGNGNSQICNLNSKTYKYSVKKVLKCEGSHYLVKISDWDNKIKNSMLSWFILENDFGVYKPKLMNVNTDSVQFNGWQPLYASLLDSFCRYDYFLPLYKYISLQEIKKDTTLNKLSICMVTNQNNHNLVVWENIDNNYVSKYRIYKQNQVTSKYELVHEQSKHEISQWLDSLSTSNTNIDRYKILILDSCGNETTLSNNHSTMLLSSNVGLNGTVNLSWNAYEGFDYQNFEIWRSSDGSNFIKIGTVANNSYAYIDNNPPVNAWYQIRISKQEVCNPTKRTINYVNSNIISKDGKSLEINEKDETSISVHPNPVHSELTVNSTVNGVMKCQILNIEGKIMMEEVISTSHSKIDVQNLEQGIYFIRVNESNIKFFKN